MTTHQYPEHPLAATYYRRAVEVATIASLIRRDPTSNELVKAGDEASMSDALDRFEAAREAYFQAEL